MLKVVPPSAPSAKDAAIERIKQLSRPPGVIQCARCGSRSIMTIVSGSWIDHDGKYRRGTVCEDKVCYDCHRKGAWSPMMPDRPKLVKEPKPRRTRPKAAK